MSKKAKKTTQRLSMWQTRYEKAKSAYTDELKKMDGREELYRGSKRIKPIVENQQVNETPHVRNIVAELIEAQVSSSIPQPKVTARRRKDEHLARVIEDMLRNELDRLPVELIHDMASRTVPIQGGTYYEVEWDSDDISAYGSGELALGTRHPKNVVPQPGVYTSVEDMDYIFVRVAETKNGIKRRYGVDVSFESESEPDIKGAGDESSAEDLVTLITAYYRNDSGGIGRYTWVGDIELEDLDDYQARRVRHCAVCGAREPSQPMETLEPTADGTPGEHTTRKKGTCPYCGSDAWEYASTDYEELWAPVTRSDGTQIGGSYLVDEPTGEYDEFGLEIYRPVEKPTLVPSYKPDIYPLILQRNVSVYGRLLGDSDVDRISTQQNTTNRLEAKIIEKLISSGSFTLLPNDASIEMNDKDGRIVRLPRPEQAQFVAVYNLEGNVSQDLAYKAEVYEEAKQLIGVTESFLGRPDSTATSGKAKEFAAAQSAGRLDSKRAMLNFAWSQIFEAMYKFRLAYADEPRPVVAHEPNGDTRYEQFNRWDFLEPDPETGGYTWNDRFLFSVDTSATLAANREAMWQETRLNLQTGAFGDPTDFATLVMFWSKLEQLHYPGAGETRRFLEERQQAQQAAMMRQQMQMMQQFAQPPMPQMPPQFTQSSAQPPGIPQGLTGGGVPTR